MNIKLLNKVNEQVSKCHNKYGSYADIVECKNDR